jgi:hypothetical protein
MNPNQNPNMNINQNNMNPNMNINQNNINQDFLNNMSNDNLINIANSIDTLPLNGTNLVDYNNTNNFYDQRNKNTDNTSLIKSLTKEIISNMKENGLDDNFSLDDNIPSKSNKNKDFKETLEDFVTEKNPIPSTNGYIHSIMNDYINYKDFILIFAIYFVLSQEMVKDFFGNYFNSLNPDSEGKVNIQGVIIYGLILSTLFIVLKKLF